MILMMTILAAAVPGIIGAAFLMEAHDAALRAGTEEERARRQRPQFGFEPPGLVSRSTAAVWAICGALAFLVAGIAAALVAQGGL